MIDCFMISVTSANLSFGRKLNLKRTKYVMALTIKVRKRFTEINLGNKAKYT